MSGRHADPSRSSVGRDIVRSTILLAILAVVLIGGSLLLTNLSGSGGDVKVAESTTTTTADTVPASNTPSTGQTPVTGSTTTATDPTTTTVAKETTTTRASTTSTTEAPVAVALQPSEVSVLVLNSTSRPGLASRLAAKLNAIGYQTPEPTNYSPALDQSRVWYVDGFRLEAEAVAALVPDALVELTPSDSPGAPITVVLGASFTE